MADARDISTHTRKMLLWYKLAKAPSDEKRKSSTFLKTEKNYCQKNKKLP